MTRHTTQRDSAAGFSSGGLAFGLGNIFGFQKIFEFGHELSDIFEIEVNGGEANVCDFVVAAEAAHDEFTDFAGFALALGGLDNERLGLVHDLLEFADWHGAFFAGAHQAVENFLAVEAFAASIFLDDHVRDFVDALVGGKALFALETFAAAANGVGFLALARVDYFIVFKAAKWAFHELDGIWKSLIVAGARVCRRAEEASWLRRLAVPAVAIGLPGARTPPQPPAGRRRYAKSRIPQFVRTMKIMMKLGYGSPLFTGRLRTLFPRQPSRRSW